MTIKQAIKKVQDADITEWGWHQPIIEALEDRYAAGYLSCTLENLGNKLDSSSEEYRQELLYTMKYMSKRGN